MVTNCYILLQQTDKTDIVGCFAFSELKPELNF